MLLQQIEKDLTEAMKAKDETKISTLRMLKSALHNWQIAGKKALPAGRQEPQETDILALIQKEIKSRKDSIEMYQKGGRQELAAKEEKEIEILQKYLPEPASVDEIRSKIKKTIVKVGATGPQDIGKVMGPLMAELKGKADGGLVSKIVKEELGKA